MLRCLCKPTSYFYKPSHLHLFLSSVIPSVSDREKRGAEVKLDTVGDEGVSSPNVSLTVIYKDGLPLCATSNDFLFLAPG